MCRVLVCLSLLGVSGCASSVQIVSIVSDASVRESDTMVPSGPAQAPLPTREVLLDELVTTPSFARNADVLAVGEDVYVLEAVPPYSFDKIDRTGMRSRIASVGMPQGRFRLHRLESAFAIVDEVGVTLVTLDGRVEPRQQLASGSPAIRVAVSDSFARGTRLVALTTRTEPIPSFELLDLELRGNRFHQTESCSEAGVPYGFLADERTIATAYVDDSGRVSVRRGCNAPTHGQPPPNPQGRVLSAAHAQLCFSADTSFRVASVDLETAELHFGDPVTGRYLFSDDHGGYFAATDETSSTRRETFFTRVVGTTTQRGAWTGVPFPEVRVATHSYALLSASSACTSTWCVQAASANFFPGSHSEVRIIDLDAGRMEARATTAEFGTHASGIEAACMNDVCTIVARGQGTHDFFAQVNARTGALRERRARREPCARDLCVEEAARAEQPGVLATFGSDQRWWLDASYLLASVATGDGLVAVVERATATDTVSELGVIQIDPNRGPTVFRPLLLPFPSEFGVRIPSIRAYGGELAVRAVGGRKALLRVNLTVSATSHPYQPVLSRTEFLVDLDSLESRRLASWRITDAQEEFRYAGQAVSTPDGFAYFGLLMAHNDAVVQFYDSPWERAWTPARIEEIDDARGTSRWLVGGVRAMAFSSSKGLIAALLRDGGESDEPVELVIRNLSDGAEARVPDLLVMPILFVPANDEAALIVYPRASDRRIAARLVPIPSAPIPPR